MLDEPQPWAVRSAAVMRVLSETSRPAKGGGTGTEGVKGLSAASHGDKKGQAKEFSRSKHKEEGGAKWARVAGLPENYTVTHP